MRTSRALAVCAVAAATVGLAAPAATAWTDPKNITASPSVIARGGQLTVTVDGTACQMSGSTVESRAFPKTRLNPVPGGTLASATVRVNSNAQPGPYDITARCGEGRTLTRPAAFTVIGGVRGGFGGSIAGGATDTDVAVGGSMVGTALLGGGIFWMRRRAESRA